MSPLARFGAAFFGWVLAGLAAPVAVTALIAVVTDGGFAYLLAVPVVLLCFFVLAPLLIGELVGKEAGIGARQRATRATPRGALLSLVALWLGAWSGGAGVVIGLVVLITGVPALVTWRTRPRTPGPPA